MDFLFVALILTISVGVVQPAAVDPCAADADQVNVGPVRVDPGNCAGYVMCEHVGNFKRTHYKGCKPGLIFDPVPLWCDYCNKVDCGTRPLPDGHCEGLMSSVNATTTETPLPPPDELLGDSCKDIEQLVRYVITNNTNAFYRLNNGRFEYVSCGPWMFSLSICNCDAPGAQSLLYKEGLKISVVSGVSGGIFPIVYDFEGDFKATRPGHNRVWTGVYDQAYIVPGGIVHKRAAMFKEGRMEIPYFQNTFFEQLTVAFYYKRSSKAGSGTMGLVNNGRSALQPSIQIFCERTYIRASLLTDVTTYEIQHRDRSNPLEADVWHHVAFVYNTTSLELYVNGTGRVEIDVEGNMLRRPQASMVVGRDYYIDGDLGQGTSSFVGMMDDLRFYDRALDDDEVMALFESRNGNNKT
ncbi:uncharacterized protein LOC106165203 [Lingula anatina]|uniref:Uncharacterized protein LOC106165203 n=1 Tax=Lingula anatina TaxID=7574 RepID=A0A1S3ILJ7_LINAN|nr:uncharacterized protein LOC106165203 [Lingula anatina]|eukprot:XP_013398766.1 uncharacterized protein LOC106165203 [Lingula anatina]